MLKKYSIFGLIAIVVSLLCIWFYPRMRSCNKPYDAALEGNRENISKKGSIFAVAKRSIGTERVKSGSKAPERQKLTSDTNLPSECKGVFVEKQIFSLDVEESYGGASHGLEEPTQICLQRFGGPVECFAEKARSESETLFCINNLAIARARFIENATQDVALEKLSPELISNKIIAVIYNGDFDSEGTQLFSLADRLIEFDGSNNEAHNIRSYFGLQSLKKTLSQEVLDKGKESAEILASSPQDRDHKRGLLFEYGYQLVDFLLTKNSDFLNQAEETGLTYIRNYPNEPEGYYILMTTSGYKGDMTKTLEWVSKGLSFGEQQHDYSIYAAIRKSIINGNLKVQDLGVRIDPSDQFNPAEILQQ